MRKIKYSRLVTLIIFVYILFQFGLNAFAKSIDTLVLENEQIEFKLNAKGLLVREEHVVYSNSSGKVETLVDEGEKIAKSQEVATIYSDKKDVETVKEIEMLNEEINALKSGEKNFSSEEITKLNNEIEEISTRIQLSLLNQQYNEISSDKEALDSIIEQRNRLLNNDIDTKKLETKESQKKILSTKLEKNTSTLSSEISGIVSFKVDGNEEKFTLDKLSQLTKKDIQNTDNNYREINTSDSNVKNKEPILRLIDNNNMYMAICVEKSKSEKFDLNKNVKLNYKDDVISAKIDNIYEDGQNTIVIFKITSQNIGIYDTRVEEFDIIYKQIDGLKIPKTSIEVVDDTQGVYVVNQENNDSYFVKLEGIVYEDDEYVYIDYYNNKVNGINSINLYDEIILKPNSISKNIKIK